MQVDFVDVCVSSFVLSEWAPLFPWNDVYVVLSLMDYVCIPFSLPLFLCFSPYVSLPAPLALFIYVVLSAYIHGFFALVRAILIHSVIC